MVKPSSVTKRNIMVGINFIIITAVLQCSGIGGPKIIFNFCVSQKWQRALKLVPVKYV
jgi:hypothetical protein